MCVCMCVCVCERERERERQRERERERKRLLGRLVPLMTLEIFVDANRRNKQGNKTTPVLLPAPPEKKSDSAGFCVEAKPARQSLVENARAALCAFLMSCVCVCVWGGLSRQQTSFKACAP